MTAAFLDMADSNNSLDATKQTMQHALVAFSDNAVKLKNTIGKKKPASKPQATGLFGAAVSPAKRPQAPPHGFRSDDYLVTKMALPRDLSALVITPIICSRPSVRVDTTPIPEALRLTGKQSELLFV